MSRKALERLNASKSDLKVRLIGHTPSHVPVALSPADAPARRGTNWMILMFDLYELYD